MRIELDSVLTSFAADLSLADTPGSAADVMNQYSPRFVAWRASHAQSDERTVALASGVRVQFPEAFFEHVRRMRESR